MVLNGGVVGVGNGVLVAVGVGGAVAVGSGDAVGVGLGGEVGGTVAVGNGVADGNSVGTAVAVAGTWSGVGHQLIGFASVLAPTPPTPNPAAKSSPPHSHDRWERTAGGGATICVVAVSWVGWPNNHCNSSNRSASNAAVKRRSGALCKVY